MRQNQDKNRSYSAAKKTVIVNNYDRRYPARRQGQEYPAHTRQEPSKGQIAMGAFGCILGAFALCSKVLDITGKK